MVDISNSETVNEMVRLSLYLSNFALSYKNIFEAISFVINLKTVVIDDIMPSFYQIIFFIALLSVVCATSVIIVIMSTSCEIMTAHSYNC